MTRILESDDCGAITLPPDVLQDPQPHARYRVEASGNLITVLPEILGPPNDVPDRGSDQWLEEWHALADKIGMAWKLDKSAAELVSEMR